MKPIIIATIIGVVVVAIAAGTLSSTPTERTVSNIDKPILNPIPEQKESTQTSSTTQNNCDPSYPDVCIPPWPPDLDCEEIVYSDFRVIQPDKHGFDGDKDGIGCKSLSQLTILSSYSSQDCSGNARCIIGKVTQVIDGDTIKVDGQSIRFALASAPELNEFGGADAKKFIETICPIGSDVLVDEDDKQTQGSYGRIIGVIICNEVNLNEELLDADLGYLSSGFCRTSEFSNLSWAQKHGCMTSSVSEPNVSVQDTHTQNNCDPSYPDFCIPSSPPDLDCKDITQKRFTVLQPDPHRFDGDKDGIGCES